MKTLGLIAAAAAAMIAIPATASAAPVSAPSAAVSAAALAPSAQVHVTVRTDRHMQRRHHARRAYWRKVCTNRWSHGHRVRTCRNVRYWR